MNRQDPKMNLIFQKITILPASFIGCLKTQAHPFPKEGEEKRNKVQSPLYIKNQANKPRK